MFKQLHENDYRPSEGLSNSFLLRFRKNPATAFIEKKPSESMIFGSAFHSMILESKNFEKDYFFGDFDLRTKAGKELAESQSDKICMKTNKLYDLNDMKKNLLNFRPFFNLGIEKTVSDYLEKKDTLKEYCFFWYDKNFPSILKKAKLDFIYFDHEKKSIIIFDLKTTDDASSFEKSIQNYMYYRQAQWYSEAVVNECPGYAVDFVFLACETSNPFGVMAYEISKDYLSYAATEAYCDLLKYSDWVRRGSNIKEVYQEGLTEIKKPTWL